MMNKGQNLYNKAKKIIPGGTQLLSKRPEMFLPDYWPAYYDKAKGCEVTDMDGNKFYDMSYMGIGSCILGYADEDVNRAVEEAIKKGSMCTLNSYEEVELAELLIEIHPWAEMVRYARTGGEAMSVAVRIARAHSKKDYVLFCGYHGWHDWYLSANLADNKCLDGHLIPGLNPLGVPRNLTGLTIPFEYNDSKSFAELIEKYHEKTGTIVLETIRNYEPEKEFLEAIRKYSSKYNIPLIVDEISSGFRLNVGGAHLLYDLEPDIAVFSKGISNGYPMAAIIGKREIMNAAQDSFISSTYWTERIGPVAAIATINKMKNNKVPDVLIKYGKQIKSIWEKISQKNKVEIHISGIDPLCHFDFKYDNPLLLKTYITQEMLASGFLATNAFYSSYSHSEEILNKYEKELDIVFGKIKTALDDNSTDKLLKGQICHSGFKRLN